MDLSFSAEYEKFREQVRAFLAENWSAEDAAVEPPADERNALGGPIRVDPRATEFRRKACERGYLYPHVPKRYGGGEKSPDPLAQTIIADEFRKTKAPHEMIGQGPSMLVPTLIEHGTEEQKKQFVEGTILGKIKWCQGYSEPGSGSDLASLQTRAIRDGDDFVVNGQKIWTSGAHLANMIFMLVRTDPEAPKHRGITYLLSPMNVPGIEVRPLVQMSDARGFNETFFEDVRIPVKNAVGEINRGWYVGATHLDFERSSIGSAVGQRKMLDTLKDYLLKERDSKSGKTRLGQVDAPRLEFVDRYIEATVAKTLSQRVISMQARGLIPNYEASMTKVFATEFSQRIARTSTKLLGLYGGLRDRNSDYSPMKGRWATMYLSSVSATIAGGTSEIQRNVIATRGLGLPRG